MTIEVVRSEEELRAGVRRTASERVVVRTKVVTEEVTLTVSVRKQVVEIERLPIDDAIAEAEGLTLERGPDLVEVVLHEERPIVSLEVVPVERIRVTREVVRDSAPVRARLSREEVELTSLQAYEGAPAGQELFPIIDYDDLTVDQIVPLLDRLDAEDLAEVAHRERAGKARAGVLRHVGSRLDSLRGPEPA